MDKRIKSILHKSFKIIGWTSVSLLIVLITAILAIRTPYVQTILVRKAIGYLESKIGSKVTLENIYISFPKSIVLNGFYAEDKRSDTLIYVGNLRVDTDLWGLTQHQVQLNSLQISNTVAKLNRPKSDSLFNFDYIIKAFAAPTAELDTTSSPWDFSINKISLNNIVVEFKDQFERNYCNAKIGELDVSLEGSDIVNSSYKISDLKWSNSIAQISTSQSRSGDSSPNQDSSTPFSFDLSKIDVTNLSITYEQPDRASFLHVKLNDFQLEANQINLSDHTIDLKRIELNNSFIAYREGQVSKPDSTLQEISNAPAWNIKLGELSLKDNGFQYDNANERVSGFDQNHVWILSSDFLANDIEIEGSKYKAEIQNLSFKERNGMEIESFKSQILLSDSQFSIKDFDLNTGNSRVAINANGSFKLTKENTIDYSHTMINVDIENSFIALDDILFFTPTLFDSLPIHLSRKERIFLDTQVKGNVDDVVITKFYAQLLDSTVLDLTGSVKGLPDLDNTYWDLKFNQFLTTRENVMQVLYDSMLPAAVQIPEWVRVEGDFKGTLKSSVVNALVKSSVGSIEANGRYDLALGDTYDLQVTTDNLNIGKLLKQDQMDTLNLALELKGAGLTLETLDALVHAKVDKFKFNGYTYSDFELNGSFKEFLFSGSSSLNDKNLDFVINAELDYASEIPHYKATFNLKNADFLALRLSERPLRAKATLDVNFSIKDFNRINGDIGIRKVAIYNGETLYKVDSLLVVSIDQEEESSISIRSDIVMGDFKGTFNVLEIPKTLKHHINQYFSMQDSTIHAFEKPQYFTFDLTLKNTDLLTDIVVPQLKSFVPGKIEGKFDSEQNLLTMNIGVTKIKYATTGVDSLLIKIDSDAKAFNYKVRLKNLILDTLHITAVQVQGQLANNQLQTELIILDSANNQKYRIAGKVNSRDNGFKFSLLQDQLVINYKKWEIPSTNFIDFKRKVIHASDFKLTKENEKFEIVTNETDSSLAFRFNQFQLANLTHLVEGVIPASGLLNGDLKFMNSTKGEFRSKLLINELTVFEKLWGDADFSIAQSKKRYTINFKVMGENINLHSDGYYESNVSKSELSLNVRLASLNLELLEPLSFGQLTNVKGNGSGEVEVKSEDSKFSLRGEMFFSNADFTSTYLKNSFSLKKERIVFSNEGIVFDNFRIQDVNSNQAIVKGVIKTKMYEEFVFDLRASMKKFQILNTKEGDNELYYGLVKVDAEAVISGTFAQPKVDLALTIGDDSNFTYIIPESQKSAQEMEGIVKFVDYDAHLDPFLANLTAEDTAKTVFKGFDLSANLDLGDKALLNIILDPRTGDKLSVNGNASLVLNMEASGEMDLSGRYEITKGTYNFSFQNLAKREFNLVKGSTIEWTGDPLNATLDISASFLVDASPLELVYSQVSSANQSEINSYNQRLPFIVYLLINGRLLEPIISFRLDMPEDKRNAFGGAIYSKLQDINTRESDLNKQVFSLIILKRFTTENPLESQSASSISNTARQSVSRILSDQLNRLSENIKGIELSFDIKSYENFTGEEVQGETKAQLGVSKNLFDDRLVVKLAGNIDLEGGNGLQQEVTDYIGDIALEYKLTSDGRFRITGFRNSNFDIINGELIETGAGLIYIKDYNTLRELLKPNAKRK